MSMRPLVLVVLLTGCVSPDWQEERTEEQPAEYDPFSIDLGYARTGLSFGNSPVWNGIRVNVRDHRFKEINGLNVTLWEPGSTEGSEINGIALGLYGPEAHNLTGISLGAVATVCGDDMVGVQVSGIATVSSNDMEGVHVGGVALVSDDEMTGVGGSLVATVCGGDMTGIHVGGLVVVADGDMTGIHVGGLANAADGDMTGIDLSLLANFTQGEMSGIHLAGLANVAEDGLSGVQAALLGVMSGGDINGIAAGGLYVVGGSGDIKQPRELLGRTNEDEEVGEEDDATRDLAHGSINGLGVALYRVDADEVNGLAVGGIMTRMDELFGLAVGAFNRVSEEQNGVTLGLVNSATTLKGASFQIGLLNHVESNPVWARYLPIFNTSF